MHGITYVGINMPTQVWGRQPTFYFALTGLEEDIGDIIPRLVCFYVKILDSCLRRNDRGGTGWKMDSLSRLFASLRVLPGGRGLVVCWLGLVICWRTRKRGGRCGRPAVFQSLSNQVNGRLIFLSNSSYSTVIRTPSIHRFSKGRLAVKGQPSAI